MPKQVRSFKARRTVCPNLWKVPVIGRNRTTIWRGFNMNRGDFNTHDAPRFLDLSFTYPSKMRGL